MRRRLLVLGLLLAASACAPRHGPSGGEEAASGPPPHRRRLEAFLETVRYRDLELSPDGQQLWVASDRDGQFELAALALDGTPVARLAPPTDEALDLLSPFPGHDRRLLLAAGVRRPHLFRLDPPAPLVELFPGATYATRFLGWAAKGGALFLASDQRLPGTFDVLALEPTYGEPQLVREGTPDLEPLAVSPDRRWLLGWQRGENGGAKLVVVDLAGFDETRILDDTANALVEGLTPSGDAVLLATRTAADGGRVERVNLASGERTLLVEVAGAVRRARLTAAERWLIVEWSERGQRRLLVRASSGENLALPSPTGTRPVAAVASADGRLLAYEIEGPGEVRDLMTFEVASGAARQLTYSASPQLDPEDFAVGEPVTIGGAERELAGWLYVSRLGAVRDKARIVWIDDGPTAETERVHPGLLQHLVNRGHPVLRLAPVHAPTADESPTATATRLAGLVPTVGRARDLLLVRAASAGAGPASPTGASPAVLLVGFGPGADLALATLAAQPGSFVAGAACFGLVGPLPPDLIAPPAARGKVARPAPPGISQSTGPGPTPPPAPAGPPPEDRSAWLARLATIRTPVLLVGGGQDRRQSPTAAGELVAALAARGVPAEALVLPLEEEALLRREDTLQVARALLDLLARHTGEVAVPPPG